MTGNSSTTEDQKGEKRQLRAAWLAYIAMVTGLISFIPAIYQVYAMKSSCSISKPGLWLRLLGIVLWLGYAALNGISPNIISNSVTLFLTVIFIFVVYKYSTGAYRYQCIKIPSKTEAYYYTEPVAALRFRNSVQSDVQTALDEIRRA